MHEGVSQFDKALKTHSCIEKLSNQMNPMKKTMMLTQRTSSIPSLVLFLPEVGFGELLHVQLLVCEGGQVDISNSGEHFT